LATSGAKRCQARERFECRCGRRTDVFAARPLPANRGWRGRRTGTAPASRTPHPASRTGAQVMCEALVREDVEVMFGIPGGAIMPFYHAMWEYRDRLRHVLCRHEQGAGHAEEGYARSPGKPGVCIGTS